MKLEGQTDRSNVFPPTPDVASIGKFIDQPMSLSRGIPDISLPFYNLRVSDELSYPLSLQYQAGGIRVEEMAGKTGLGWNMGGMGMITRTVKDSPDDASGSGYMYTTYDIAKIKLMVHTSEEGIELNNQKEYIDAEPDEYNVSANGLQFRFFYDKQNARFVQAPLSKVKLEPQYNGAQIISWILTDTNGIKYYFGTNNKVEYSDLSQTITLASDAPGAEGGVSNTLPHILTWYLVKIEDTKNNVLEFQYKLNPTYQYYSKAGESTVKFFPSDKVKYINYSHRRITAMSLEKIKFNTTEIEFVDDTADRLDLVYNKALKEIKVKENGKLIKKAVFNYSYFTSDNSKPYDHYYYFTEDGYRLKLDNVNIYNGTDPKPQKYEFIYNSRRLPSKYSYSQDAWGFYNGESNSELIPKTVGYFTDAGTAKRNVSLEYAKACILEKIIYPTGGFTTYEYESNRASRVIRPAVLRFGEVETRNFWLEADKDIGPVNVTVIDKPEYRQRLSINRPGSTVTLMTNVEGCTNQLNNSNCKYTVKIVGVNNSTNMTITQSQLSLNLPKGEYDVIALKAGNGNSQTLGFSVVAYWDELLDDPFNLIVGGLRTKRIKFFDSDGASLLTKQFEYDYIQNGETVSSGNIMDYPVFVFNYTAGLGFSESKISSNPVSPLANLAMASVIYDRVTEKRIDAQSKTLGRTEYSYTFDMKTDPEYYTEGTINTDLTASVFGWRNGLLLYRKDFDENNNILRSVINEYTSKNKFSINNFGAYFEARKKNATPFYSYMFYPFITDTYSIDTSETIDYFNGNPVKTLTEYFYNNPQHYQVTSEKTIKTDSSIQETIYRYAQEKNNTKLINANMIAIPLETEVKKNNKTVSKTETLYNDVSHLFPTSVQSLNIQGNLMSTEVTYDKYDSKGNLQQYTSKDGLSTTIIWGYNNTQPIAKIEGAKLADIPQSLIDGIVNASNNDDQLGTDASEQSLISALDLFRNHSALSGYQITTYSYDPLIGVKSITPPSGIREVYLYDTANRLKEIRENSTTGKTLKEFKYNYKN
ncbi:hypothetical protein AU378_17195 [Chryseobacterium kwangjuense]|uniref:Sugar-binding protein n=2 Tax=Chryseobacterium kwangjuense TaxID=267125 RepID=A0A135W929_9FLAO|nr:hypothetical protein AU378_17195 [Chryseobacterium kwangjuense]